MTSQTAAALRAFIVSYREHTGKQLTQRGLIGDKQILRSALDEAVELNVPALYQAAEDLVLALRRSPLPAAA